MSEISLIDQFKRGGCLPHQAEFAAQFVAADSAPKHLLVSGPGLGKTFVTASIVNHTFVSGQARRILVLCPASLVAQWQHVLLHHGPTMPVITVDRRTLREFEDKQTDAKSIWPTSAVVVMSIDFASIPDVTEQLAQAGWDLLVVDEFHRIKPKTNRYKCLAILLSRSPAMRMMMLTSQRTWSELTVDPDSDLMLRGTVVTEWLPKAITDQNGRPLLQEVKFEWITYRRKVDEVAVLSSLQERLRTSGQESESSQFLASILLQCGSSSLFALEQRLRRICQRRDRFVHGKEDGVRENAERKDVEAETEVLDSVENGELSLQVGQFADQMLSAIEDVESDSKLDTLVGFLSGMDKGRIGLRICIVTRFFDTASYLETTLREHFSAVAKMHGSLSAIDREQVLDTFDKSGGILIVTEAMSMVMPDVTGVIFYDLPLNPVVLDARIGDFVRIGRREPVRLFAFTDETNALLIESLQKKIADIGGIIGERPLDVAFQKEFHEALFPNANGSNPT
jgi:SNF2 family DNA or RNA helicase